MNNRRKLLIGLASVGAGATAINHAHAMPGGLLLLASNPAASQMQNVRIFNVLSYGAVGNGMAQPASTVYGTLPALQAVYPFATSLTNNLDSLALQAAINAAAAEPNGGAVYVPRGNYIHNMAITNPGVTNTNAIPPVPEIEMFGDGMIETVMTWPVDSGTGTFAFASANRSETSYSRFKMSDMAIVGPGVGSTLGSSTCQMGGVGASNQWYLERVWISGFLYGVALRQDHQTFRNCQINSNYYNVYFQAPPSGTDNTGNQVFDSCILNGCNFASVAVAAGATITSTVWVNTSIGFGPYGFYRESGSPSLAFVYDTEFFGLYSESCGNGVFYGENSGDNLEYTDFYGFTTGMTNSSTYKISGRTVKAAFYLGGLVNCNFYGAGDITGANNSFNAYNYVTDALIEAQDNIQGNYFSGAYNMVANSTASIPALKAPTVLFNTYDTTQSKGRFLTAQATFVVGAPVCEGGFDEAVAWSSSKMFAGIAMAPATSGVVMPVSDSGIALANKTVSTLVINQGDPLTPTTGGVTNADALSGAGGIAWQGSGNGTATVNMLLASRGFIA